MLAISLTIIYILFNIFLCFLLNKWINTSTNFIVKHKITKFLIYFFDILCSCSILIAFLVKNKLIRRIFYNIGYWWLGFMIYITMIAIIIFIIKIILKKKMKKKYKKIYTFRLGLIGIIITLSICILGFFNARCIRETNYDLTINKDSKLSDLKVVLVADFHLGYNIGTNVLENMVNKINKKDADIVLIAGDIFDNDYEAIDNPDRVTELLKSIKSKYGVYAVYGNHDIKESILMGFTFKSSIKKESDLRMDKLLEDSNITLLKDESLLIDDAFYLIGRPDIDRLNRGIEKRKDVFELTTDLDLTKPIILMEHEPVELSELGKTGIDLDLNGHTHDGQFFPLNYLIKLKFKNTYGLKKYGNMYDIVTSGVGLYGVNMRVATYPEVVTINLKFGGSNE